MRAQFQPQETQRRPLCPVVLPISSSPHGFLRFSARVDLFSSRFSRLSLGFPHCRTTVHSQKWRGHGKASVGISEIYHYNWNEGVRYIMDLMQWIRKFFVNIYRNGESSHKNTLLWLSQNHKSMETFFSKKRTGKNFGGQKSFSWGQWYPCFDFWWRLPWVSKPGWIPCMLDCLCDPQIHLWCDTYWLKRGQHGRQAFWSTYLKMCPQALVEVLWRLYFGIAWCYRPEAKVKYSDVKWVVIASFPLAFHVKDCHIYKFEHTFLKIHVFCSDCH